MSLSVDGIWKTGVWAQTVWADDVWFEGARAAEEAVKTGTGGVDPQGRQKRYPPVKPTGILHLPKKPPKEGRKELSDRVEESRQIQSDIAARLAREFTEDAAQVEARPPIAKMSMAQIEAEIGFLLRKKLINDEEEVLLLLLMVAAAEL